MPEGWRREELTTITERRATALWDTTRRLLEAYDRILVDLHSSRG